MSKKLGWKASDKGSGATAVTDAPQSRRKPKQPMLNDDEAFQQIKEIENLAVDYVEARDRRQALLADEVDLKEKLMAAMKRNNMETYSFDGYMVEIVRETENVKVKKKRAAKEDGGLE